MADVMCLPNVEELEGAILRDTTPNAIDFTHNRFHLVEPVMGILVFRLVRNLAPLSEIVVKAFVVPTLVASWSVLPLRRNNRIQRHTLRRRTPRASSSGT